MGALAPAFDARQALADRDQALTNAAQALDLLVEAQRVSGMRECPILGQPVHFRPEERLERYRQQADTAGWWRLMDASGLYPIMDERARRQWRKELDEGRAPPLTADTIAATFSDLFERRGAMLEQAVEDLFRRVSWSNDAPRPLTQRFRVGGFANPGQWGSLAADLGGCRRLATLLAVMDGRNDAERVGQDFHHACMSGFEARKARCPYFAVEWFKNGRAKVEVERMDLADRLNGVMAKRWPGLFPAVESGGMPPAKSGYSKSNPGGLGRLAFGP